MQKIASRLACSIEPISLTKKQIRRGVRRSTRELEHAICRFVDHNNQQSRPFVWTNSAD